MSVPSFPSLSILAALANSGSRAVTLADSLWFRGGRMQGLFAYDETLRRIVFNERDWSVSGGAGGITATAYRANHSPDSPAHARQHSSGSVLFASREDEMAEEELRRKAYEHFVLRRDDDGSSCDIVAILVYGRTGGANAENGSAADDQAAQKPRLVVDFLGSDRLGTFLKQPIADQDVLVCRYMGPGMGNWSVVQCVWTDNRLIAVERRVNKHQIHDRSLPMATRVSTSAADAQHNQPVPVPPGSQARLAKICAAIAAAMNSGAFDPPSGAERYGLYFFSNIPFGTSGKSGRWVFLGANEAPLPHLDHAPPSLQQVIPPRPVGGGTQQRSKHAPRDAAPYEEESVTWTVEGSPSAMKHSMSFMAEHFKPRRMHSSFAERPQTTPALPTIIEGTRRVKPKRVWTPSTTMGSRPATTPQQMRRAMTPGAGSVPPHPLLNRGDVSGLLGERSNQLALAEAAIPLTASEWKTAVTDVSLLGYLASPPFARSASPPAALRSRPTTTADARSPSPKANNANFSMPMQRSAPSPGSAMSVSSPFPEHHTANRDAAAMARPFSRNACLSAKALQRSKANPGTSALPPAEVTYVGRSVFKTSFVSRLIQAMDTHEAQQREVPASIPATPNRRRVSPLSSELLEEQRSSSPAGSPLRQATSPLSPATSSGSPAAAAAVARRSTLTAAERSTMKRRELLARYNPLEMLAVVEDALYCVYSQSLDDPTAVKEAQLLSKPLTTALNPSKASTTKLNASSSSGSAPIAVTTSTVDVPLQLVHHDGMHREMARLLRDVGVPVVEVCDAPGIEGAPITLIAKFPQKNDVASKIRIKLARLCRDLDSHIGSMSASDVVAIQREVAENGDKIFHDVVVLSMRASKSAHAMTAVAGFMQAAS